MKNQFIVEKQIEEMIRQGIIRIFKPPYCSPIVMVPKKRDASGIPKFRKAIDYRVLNEITINYKFPFLNKDEILDNSLVERTYMEYGTRTR